MSEPTSRPPGAWAYNARIGLILFALYCVGYGGFIFLSAFRREVMAQPSLGGVNLATIYGFALILGAFVLAVVYMLLCQAEPDDRPEPTEIEVATKAVEEEGGA